MTERHVLLLCLDTVRKDYFDEFAPRIQALADVSFEQTRAVSSWTVPSHASMFTGELPHRHGVHAHNVDFSSLETAETFLDSYADHRTVGISANPFVDATLGFDGLFDEFHDVTPSVVFPDGLYLRDFESDRDGVGQYVDYVKQALADEHPLKSLVNGASGLVGDVRPALLPRTSDDGAKAITELAIDAVEDADEPQFVFCNYMDGHGPFSATTKYDADLFAVPRGWSSDEIDIWEYNQDGPEGYEDDTEYYRQLYGAAIDYLDREVERLVERVEAATDRDVTVIVTADHGENLGYDADDGLIEHKGSLTEGLLHVPFVVRNPPEYVDEDATSEYFSLRSLPTVLEQIAEDRFAPPTGGAATAELVGIGARDPPLEGDAFDYWNRMIRAVVDDGEKVAWDSLGDTTRYRLDDEQSCFQRPVGSGDFPKPLDDQFFQDPIEEYKASVDSTDADDGISGVGQERLENLGYM